MNFVTASTITNHNGNVTGSWLSPVAFSSQAPKDMHVYKDDIS